MAAPVFLRRAFGRPSMKLLPTRRMCSTVSSEGTLMSSVAPSILSQRTRSTKLLWDLRQQANARLNPESVALHKQSQLMPKTPHDALTIVKLPFKSDTALREEYLSPFGRIRIGRILEDMDAMAGNVAFRHTDDGDKTTRPANIVTASVDKMVLQRDLCPTEDMILKGYVTWVGRSSMEVRTELLIDYGVDQRVAMVALFTMVARDAVEKTSVAVNPLTPISDREKELFRQGEANKMARLQCKRQSLAIQPPTPEETLILHRMFLEKAKGGRGDAVPMAATTHQSILMCQPQERNISNKIFGGYLMRKGFELAFCTAFVFMRQVPVFQALDDVVFHRPVEIGDMLCLTGTVTHTWGSAGMVLVEVIAEDIDADGSREITNTFHFAFSANSHQMSLDSDNLTTTRDVLPDSYVEGMSYLQGRRVHKALLATQWQLV